MTSEERLKAFDFLGVDAKKANLEFEKKVILKDVNRGIDSWLSTISGVPSLRVERMKRLIERRREMQAKKLFDPVDEKRFLNQLASTKIGIGISYDEAKNIYALSKKVANGKELFDKKTIAKKLQEIKSLNDKEKTFVKDLLDRISEANMNKKITSEFTSKAKADIRRFLGEGASQEQKDSLEILVGDIIKERTSGNYGVARVTLQEFVDGIKLENGKKIWMGKTDARSYFNIAKEVASTLKSLASSVDASFPGRQGLYALTSGNFKEWGRLVKNTFEVGTDVLKLPEKGIAKNATILNGVKASVFNRELGRNGIYDKMKLAVGTAEEAFPTSLPEVVPGLGRFFKASNETYTAGAYLLRADLADKYYPLLKNAVEKNGETITKQQLRDLGEYINVMTGRGSRGLGNLGETTNIFFFSPKFIQSHIDKMVFAFDPRIDTFTRTLARKNLAISMVSTGAFLFGVGALAKEMFPDVKTNLDPTSSDFGKVVVGDYRIDVTGGMAGYATIMARTYKTIFEDGYANEMTGIVSRDQNPIDGIQRFFLNKTSPFTRTLIDIATGSDFNGNAVGIQEIKEDPVNTLMVLGKNVLPITLTGAYETIKTDTSGVALAGIGLEALGFSTNKYVYNPRWDTRTAKDLNAFKQKVGRETFKKAEKEFAFDMHKTLLGLNKSDEYKKLSQEDKTRMLNALIRDKKASTFENYGFEYEEEETTEDVRDIMDRVGL